MVDKWKRKRNRRSWAQQKDAELETQGREEQPDVRSHVELSWVLARSVNLGPCLGLWPCSRRGLLPPMATLTCLLWVAGGTCCYQRLWRTGHMPCLDFVGELTLGA